jgi:hypothetical protein
MNAAQPTKTPSSALRRGSSERRVRISRFRAFWTDPARSLSRNPLAYAVLFEQPDHEPIGIHEHGERAHLTNSLRSHQRLAAEGLGPLEVLLGSSTPK